MTESAEPGHRTATEKSLWPETKWTHSTAETRDSCFLLRLLRLCASAFETGCTRLRSAERAPATLNISVTSPRCSQEGCYLRRNCVIFEESLIIRKLHRVALSEDEVNTFRGSFEQFRSTLDLLVVRSRRSDGKIEGFSASRESTIFLHAAK